MKIIVAPDSFKGTLTAVEAARAISDGWSSARPDDDVRVLPLSDGGDGLVEVVATARDDAIRCSAEVADPLSRPRTATWLLLDGGTALVESAEACGLHLIPDAARNPMATTTYGVGQLLQAARDQDVRRVLVGLGGSGTVDGGAGALAALGFRVSADDGTGLKVGAADLHRVASVDRGWAATWQGIEVELLADVTTVLLDAPAVFGPQKGATPELVSELEVALRRWADVVERDLDAGGLREREGTGAAGGLGFGLAAAVGGELTGGAARVLELVGFDAAVGGADLVITGEGHVDASSVSGKVVGSVLDASEGVPVAVLAGRVDDELPDSLTGRVDELVEAPAPDPDDRDSAAEAVRAAAADLAERHPR